MALAGDAESLARMGKKQELKRRFGFWSLLGFSVCELITWETVLALFNETLVNGGPAGSVWSFLIAWISMHSIYIVISELASLAPIAAGQYYWTYMLAPQKLRVPLSYLIGWLATMAWIAVVATETFVAGTLLQGLLVMDYPNYMPKAWQATLLTWLVAVIAVILNVLVPGLLPKVEIGTMMLHVITFFAIIATLWATVTPHQESINFVFATAFNGGSWPSQGLSYCVGFIGNVAPFIGVDASVHMAEEVTDAALTIPRVINTSMLLNGLVGFVTLITLLFCLWDIESVLNSATGFPFLQIFMNTVPSTAGVTVMGAVILLLTWIACVSMVTSSSRMTWAFSRDSGLPFSSVWSKVTQQKRVPANALYISVGIACALTCIHIGSSVAFNDVMALTITGSLSSYLVPSALLLWHRIRGNILPRSELVGTRPQILIGESEGWQVSDTTGMQNSQTEGEKQGADHAAIQKSLGISFEPDLVSSDSPDELISYVPGQLYWGPWRVPGWLGILNNVYACLFMVFTIFWSVWPPSTPVQASTMNYAIVVTGGVLILSLIWYIVRARRDYRGPLVERAALIDAGMELGSEVV